MDLSTLKKELAECRTAIYNKQLDIKYYKELEKCLLEQVREWEVLENPIIKASNLWCEITNALIAKYKTMTEENPEEAVKQLTRLENMLFYEGFLTQKEL